MTIGVPIEIDLESVSTNVTDNTREFYSSIRYEFSEGTKFRQASKIYICTQDKPVHTYTDIANHSIGDLVYGDPYAVGSNSLFEVVNGASVPKQPSEYLNETTNAWNYSSWKYRYAEIASSFDSNNQISNTVGGASYTFTKQNDGKVKIVVSFSNGEKYIDYGELFPMVLPFSDEIEAEIVTYQNQTFFVPKFFIETASKVYIKTSVKISTSMTLASEDNTFYNHQFISRIDDFVYLEDTDDMKPFDGKNYSVASSNGTMTYSFDSLSKFNSIVLGNIKANSVTATISKSGTTLKTITKTINVSRDANAILDDDYTTEILYVDSDLSILYDVGCTISLTITNTANVSGTTIYKDIELGTIMLTKSVDAGFSNLSIRNSYKDFSTFEYDTFGNADYVERAKISTYNATVDIEIEKYDMTDRLMKSLGKNIVAIDGSDSMLEGDDVFSATKKIGRVLSYSQNTKVKNNRIDNIAQYSISIEEII